MSKLRYINTTKADMELLMQIRLEMLREVNNLSDEYVYDETFVAESRKYFENGNQTTVLALNDETVVEMLIDEAKEKGVSEISLDATEMGRPLYEALGFEKNCAGMVLELR